MNSKSGSLQQRIQTTRPFVRDMLQHQNSFHFVAIFCAADYSRARAI